MTSFLDSNSVMCLIVQQSMLKLQTNLSLTLRNVKYIPEQQEMLNGTPVHCDKRCLKLTVALQRQLENALMRTFKNLRHHVLGIQFCFDIYAHALHDFIHFIDVSITTIKTFHPFSQHDEGIMQSPIYLTASLWCRVKRKDR